MKKKAIITAAGMATRFAASVGREVHKLLYRESAAPCLLERQLTLLAAAGFTSVTVVGGYRFDEMRAFINSGSPNWDADMVHLVHNRHFLDYGCAYSFITGIQTVDGDEEQIVLLEGDLAFDAETFLSISSGGDVISFSPDPIRADRSVALGIDGRNRVFYAFDGCHRSLTVPDGFTFLANSGQVWGLADADLLLRLAWEYPSDRYRGSGLDLVSEYYNRRDGGQVRLAGFRRWLNCNTVEEYRKIVSWEEAP